MANIPFKILGLHQVAIGALEKEPLEKFFEELLGLKKTSEETLKKENLIESAYKLADGATIDIMQPIDPEKKPTVHKPPLHHIGLRVDNIEAAHNWLKEKGVRIAPGGIRSGAGGKKIFFTHPKGNEESPIGSHVLLEFIED